MRQFEKFFARLSLFQRKLILPLSKLERPAVELSSAARPGQQSSRKRGPEEDRFW